MAKPFGYREFKPKKFVAKTIAQSMATKTKFGPAISKAPIATVYENTKRGGAAPQGTVYENTKRKAPPGTVYENEAPKASLAIGNKTIGSPASPKVASAKSAPQESCAPIVFTVETNLVGVNPAAKNVGNRMDSADNPRSQQGQSNHRSGRSSRKSRNVQGSYGGHSERQRKKKGCCNFKCWCCFVLVAVIILLIGGAVSGLVYIFVVYLPGQSSKTTTATPQTRDIVSPQSSSYSDSMYASL